MDILGLCQKKGKILSSNPIWFTTNFTTNSPQQLAPSCPILPICQQNHIFYKSPKSFAKQGHSGANQGETKQ